MFDQYSNRGGLSRGCPVALCVFRLAPDLSDMFTISPETSAPLVLLTCCFLLPPLMKNDRIKTSYIDATNKESDSGKIRNRRDINTLNLI